METAEEGVGDRGRGGRLGFKRERRIVAERDDRSLNEFFVNRDDSGVWKRTKTRMKSARDSKFSIV